MLHHCHPVCAGMRVLLPSDKCFTPSFTTSSTSSLIPEPQRREDALTSAAFGTLVLVDTWDILARWLRVSEQPASTAGLWNSNCWFWPRLAFAEPDVVLRLGDFLVVVEAKYRSGRNDLVAAEEGDADLCDQLVRQHRSITEPVNSRVRYAEPIEHAIAECRLVQDICQRFSPPSPRTPRMGGIEKTAAARSDSASPMRARCSFRRKTRDRRRTLSARSPAPRECPT